MTMQLGRVIGTATATIKHPTFQGERLLVIQLEGTHGKPDGEPFLVFDRLGRDEGTLCWSRTTESPCRTDRRRRPGAGA